jgi:hypothetical protein
MAGMPGGSHFARKIANVVFQLNLKGKSRLGIVPDVLVKQIRGDEIGNLVGMAGAYILGTVVHCFSPYIALWIQKFAVVSAFPLPATHSITAHSKSSP